jgi:ATP-binding cassette, subfamily B, multidrug efflux pump
MAARSTAVLRLMSSMTPALTLCINLAVAVVIWVGGKQAIAGELSTGQVVAFTNYLLTTMTPLLMMTTLSNNWAAGLASLSRLQELLDSTPDVTDAADAREVPTDAAPAVALRAVGFGYGHHAAADGHAHADEREVLHELSLCAEPGTTVAILGATGAGKSTLVNLIPRFYDVSRGAVDAFGHDARALTQASLRARIGIVPQETVLFSATIRDNLRYGRPTASHAEVEAAARLAAAHAFIAQLPEGYDTWVEQRGANFSGGQKQRS